MSVRARRRATLLAAALAAGAAGCSLLLDTGLEGLACDADDKCLPGYVCVAGADGKKTCESPIGCAEACPALQACRQGRCVPSCDGRACPAGTGCEEGVCRLLESNRELGAPCRADADCAGVGTFCLLPWGGGDGACSRECAGAGDCAAHAPNCRAFPTGRPNSTVSLCVAPWLASCTTEKDCNASDLSCGVYTSSTTPPEGVTACRARLGGGMEIGSACSGPCVNGLCVRNGASRVCSTPCGAPADCTAVMGTASEVYACLSVTLVPEATAQPKVQPLLCVPDGASRGDPCSGTLDCRADAPECVLLEGQTERKCVARCDEAGRCPGDLVCAKEAGGTVARYCPP